MTSRTTWLARSSPRRTKANLKRLLRPLLDQIWRFWVAPASSTGHSQHSWTMLSKIESSLLGLWASTRKPTCTRRTRYWKWLKKSKRAKSRFSIQMCWLAPIRKHWIHWEYWCNTWIKTSFTTWSSKSTRKLLLKTLWNSWSGASS